MITTSISSLVLEMEASITSLLPAVSWRCATSRALYRLLIHAFRVPDRNLATVMFAFQWETIRLDSRYSSARRGHAYKDYGCFRGDVSAASGAESIP